MDEVRRHRHPGRLHVARQMLTLAMSACLLASCGSHSTPDRTAGGSPTLSAEAPGPRSSVAQPRPSEISGDLQTLPATGNAAELARQLESALATLRDRRATASDVRRAGEFQQLAVRTLATAPVAFRRKVTARLHPDAALLTRSNVRAARLLHEMTSPQKKLPRWRIVAPPPAKELLSHYHEAQRRVGVPWTYLAAIHLVETRMGRIRGASTAGARGPMQFLPSTWALYGHGGNINDPRDSILAAARLLRHNGAPGDMAKALWHFNPSENYVRAVTEYARTMQRSNSAYRGYWHWRVLYRHVRGTYVLPVGYPDSHAVLLQDN